MRDSLDLRQAVIATALDMNALGINRGKSGNVSARIDTGLLITPSGMPYADIAPDDVVAMGLDGSFATRSFNTCSASFWRLRFPY